MVSVVWRMSCAVFLQGKGYSSDVSDWKTDKFQFSAQTDSFSSPMSPDLIWGSTWPPKQYFLGNKVAGEWSSYISPSSIRCCVWERVASTSAPYILLHEQCWSKQWGNYLNLQYLSTLTCHLLCGAERLVGPCTDGWTSLWRTHEVHTR
jgi:hypothetical protein